MAKPYYKSSHDAWYINVNGRPKRLGKTKEEADRAVGPICKIADVVRKFLTHHLSSKPGTYRFYAKPLEAWLKTLLISKVCDLRPYHVTEWVNGKAPTYRHNLTRAIKACFKWAVEERYIDNSPLANMKVPAGKSRGEEAYLLPEQWTKLLNRATGEFRDLVLVMYETGCRPQEARRVEARHFDRESRCWRFNAEESKGDIPRTVHLSDAAFEICRRLTLKRPAGALFRNDRGWPWSAKRLDDRFARLSKKLGFKATPYSTRHSFISEALVRGVPIATLAVLVGHCDTKMISRVYGHLEKRTDHLQAELKRAVG